MGSSSELASHCPPADPWDTIRWLSPGPRATFLGLWVREGREGSHQHRNWGFCIHQSPHPVPWHPRPCLAQPGWEGALTSPGLQDELAASSQPHAC